MTAVKCDERCAALAQWVYVRTGTQYELKPLTGDASARRYFRAGPYVAVNAPVQTQKTREFVDAARRLTAVGLHVPHLYAYSLAQGFMLQENLGERLLSQAALGSEQRRYYLKAAAMLPELCSARSSGLPVFDEAFMRTELGIFTEWLLDKRLHLELSASEQEMLKQSFAKLTKAIAAMPQSAVHRDFHSRNLMVLADDSLAVIDFQDMVLGPVVYDAASLIYDCYVVLPEELAAETADITYRRLQALGRIPGWSFNDFKQALLTVSLQRHLKVLGIFNRLYLRDGKSGYLKDLPRVLDYALKECAALEEFKALGAFLSARVLPEIDRLRLEDGASA